MTNVHVLNKILFSLFIVIEKQNMLHKKQTQHRYYLLFIDVKVLLTNH